MNPDIYIIIITRGNEDENISKEKYAL